jgi:hypothetical protein
MNNWYKNPTLFKASQATPSQYAVNYSTPFVESYRLENTSVGHNKVYITRIYYYPRERDYRFALIAFYGRIGSVLKQLYKGCYRTETMALDLMMTLVNEKIGKGYDVVNRRYEDASIPGLNYIGRAEALIRANRDEEDRRYNAEEDIREQEKIKQNEIAIKLDKILEEERVIREQEEEKIRKEKAIEDEKEMARLREIMASNDNWYKKAARYQFDKTYIEGPDLKKLSPTKIQEITEWLTTKHPNIKWTIDKVYKWINDNFIGKPKDFDFKQTNRDWHD